MAKQSGLGRGLASLISSASSESAQHLDAVDELDISLIEANPEQPRIEVNEEKLEELARSIEIHGLLQPIVVRPHGDKYQIIAGERRWQACKKVGLPTVPVRILAKEDTEVLELALVENLQREDLNPIEAAYGYKRLIEREGFTHGELASRLAKSRPSIANALRLLDLPEEVQMLVFEGKLTAGHARAILAVSSDEGRIKLAVKTVEDGLSVRDVENIARLYEGGALPKSRRVVSPRTYKNIARRLRRLLTASVRVKATKTKSKIEIEFLDEADLVRIFDIMAGKVSK